MSTTTSKQVITPEFTIGRAIKATVGEKIVTLEGGGGYFDVLVQTAPCLPTKIGRIVKDGTGWNAHFIGDKLATPGFVGDYFPRRTGKQTQTYALCYLVARAVGFDSMDATYSLHYDGVKA